MISGPDDATRERIARIARAIDWSATAADGLGDGDTRDTRNLQLSELLLEDGWKGDAWASSLLTQMRALTGRHCARCPPMRRRGAA